MTNKEIESKIKRAFTSNVPDVFDSVLCNCEQQEAKEVKVTAERKLKVINIRKIISVAAAVAIVFTLGIVGYGIAKPDKVDSVISFDVNPSIELEINRKEKIIEAEALNEDAEKVLGNMDLKGSDLSVAVNAIIGSMLRNGYIDELSNSILISVDNKNQERGAKLEKRLFDEISAILSDEDFDSAVISQTIKKSKEIVKLAEEYGITNGKAQLIKQITDANQKYNFKDLAPLTINELNLILSGEEIVINSSGNASEEKYIGKDKAKKKALSNAGLSEADIFEYNCIMDYVGGKMIYEIKFRTEFAEYTYKINARSGKIVDSNTSEKYIGKQKAKQVALESAGTTEDQAVDYKCSFADEKYYISFNIGLVKYRIEVDAIMGEVVSIKPKGQENPNVTVAYISEADAKSIALKNSGATESEIFDYVCELTVNGKIPVYEISFKKPYDIGIEKGVLDCLFVINALNGDEIGVKKTEISTDAQQTEDLGENDDDQGEDENSQVEDEQ